MAGVVEVIGGIERESGGGGPHRITRAAGPGDRSGASSAGRAQTGKLRAALAESRAASQAALRELRESNRELQDERHIFVNGPVVVFKWRNADGWPVEYASPNVEEVFGHPAEAFLSGAVPYAEVIHPEDLERVRREVLEASGTSADRFEHDPYRVLHRNGQVVWLKDLTTILRDEEGAISHYLGYVMNRLDEQTPSACLEKPFRAEDLLDAVRRALALGGARA